MIPPLLRQLALALLLSLALVAGASALPGYPYSQTVEYAACDQAVYQQDLVIHRSAGTAYEETSGGLNVWHIYVGDHCREDYGDIRFVNSTGAELAYYLWPDYDSSSARFAVRLEGADAAGTLTVHYGNPTATTTSDGDATFPLIDNFDGTALDTTKWGVAGGTPTFADGAIKFYGMPRIASNQTFTPGNYMIQLRFKNHAQSGNNQGRIYSGFVPLANTGGNGAVCFSTTANQRLYSHYVNHMSAWSSQIDTWYESTILKSADNKHTVSVGETTSISQTAIAGDTLYLGGAYVHSSVDWVIVRAYSATPPAATAFGPEQVIKQIRDSTSNQNHGTIYGATVTQGPLGTALGFVVVAGVVILKILSSWH